MSYSLCGIDLQSSIIAGSSPLSLDGEAMIELDRNGAGAVVTKNVCLPVKNNPFHYMRECSSGTLINCERALDFSGEQWIDKEIPKAAKAGVKVIANIGMSVEQTKPIVERLEANGASMIECVSYRAEWLVPMVKDTKSRVNIPVIAKLSPNYTDFMAVAKMCYENGADAFTCGDSIGPIMKIDIETGKPFTGGSQGLGWMSGKALKPFAVKNVVDLRRNFEIPIIGMGGVSSWEDCIEMFMAGADFVGICSALVSKGPAVIREMNLGVAQYLVRHKLNCINDIKGIVLNHLSNNDSEYKLDILIDSKACIHCGECVRQCVYKALSFSEDGSIAFNADKCHKCGMCSSVCKAINEITNS